jgi:hypothetical protein
MLILDLQILVRSEKSNLLTKEVAPEFKQRRHRWICHSGVASAKFFTIAIDKSIAKKSTYFVIAINLNINNSIAP